MSQTRRPALVNFLVPHFGGVRGVFGRFSTGFPRQPRTAQSLAPGRLPSAAPITLLPVSSTPVAPVAVAAAPDAERRAAS